MKAIGKAAFPRLRRTKYVELLRVIRVIQVFFVQTQFLSCFIVHVERSVLFSFLMRFSTT
ncbi:hypothetical protein M378DRAFT_963565 [Amanita muscaria Koide BX008]|uniref:Uncharacterized protein n=1 Tax=Amanita muscaria (strain Koide BX008) TaxID=946122 RepID=A0A0C2WEM4_AMAMK|nr:hypothetical protein M378DRAFT_963565 [Amanita muscaria Koide BX008]